MAITHYIENDEEIISAVGRLRKANEAENIFVFPKRALILQSIVNLKLLEREARKLGKQIIVVTQDPEGKLLAEKAGFLTKQYHEDMMRGEQASTARFTVKHGEDIPLPVSESRMRPPRSQALGSSSFYGNVDESLSQSPVSSLPTSFSGSVPGGESRSLRIRNASPPQQTSLNSLRTSEAIQRSTSSQRRTPVNQDNAFSYQTRSSLSPSIETDAQRQEKLHRFLSGSRPDVTSGVPMSTRPKTIPPQTSHQEDEVVPSRVAPWIFAALGALSLVAILGAVVFLVLPKAEITVIPQGGEEKISAQVMASTRVSDTPEKITARIVERDISATVGEDTTGQSLTGSGKARGTVILTNNFSTASQPLVATTRLRASNGKLFRIIDGITVPGMTEKNGEKTPGVIEVNVVADEAGSSFNIDSTEFRIVGFQGGPKYDAITGKSTRAMTGGSDGGVSNGSKSVTKSDLERADQKARNQAERSFQDDITSTLAEGEHLLEKSFLVTPMSENTAPAIGSNMDHFDYTARYQIRAFIISETALKAHLETVLNDRMQTESTRLKPVSFDIQYKALLPKYDEGTIEMTIEALAKMRASIDVATLRSELLGQNEEGIRDVLSRHSEIKRLQVDFKPKIFVATIPKKNDRVNILVADEP